MIEQFGFVVGCKSDIEKGISYANVPKNELHVLKGSIFDERLKGIEGKIAFCLTANADPRYDISNYTIGYATDITIVRNDSQENLLLINNSFIDREKNEFRDNDCYDSYRITFISPSIDVLQFLRGGTGLSPFATADAPARG